MTTLRELRELGRGRLRQVVVGLFFLGLLYALSGARPLVLAVVVLALWFGYSVLDREQRAQAPEPEPVDERPQFDYTRALEQLLGIVGREVIVLIAQRSSVPPMVAQLRGTLIAAVPESDHYQLHAPGYEGDEVLTFVVDKSEFWLPHRDFVTAYEIREPGKVGIELRISDLSIAVFDLQASSLSEIMTEHEA